MTVREMGSATALLAESAAGAGFRDVLDLNREDVSELATPFVVGDSLVTLAAAVLQDGYVDYYAAAQVLGVRLPE